MKSLLSSAALSLALFAPLVAQAQKIGLSMPELDPFLTLLKNGVVEAGKQSGVTVLLEDAQRDKARQIDQIAKLIAQKVDAIIVVPVDTNGTPKITSMATNANIPLVYVNRKPNDFARLPSSVVLVASDEKVSGTLEAQEVCRLMNGKGNLLVLMGDLSNEAARTRTSDIDEVLATSACSGIRVVDKRIGNWDRHRAKTITSNILNAGKVNGKKLDAIIANNDEMALGAIAALKAAQLWTPEFVVAGIDAIPDALASMKAGELKVTVFQNAEGQGGRAIESALKLIKKQPVPRFVDVPFELVTPANVGKYQSKN
ncbi:MAG: substrate-binding domain-containing protein [Rhodoferax sp.]|nr:substrate-binding domain-containing protein [Rhodoferax sp.]MDP3652668.1 substrate-binding domain-containing protein [Rhodoferax sp.]